MKILGGTGRPRISAVVAVVGMGIAGFSVAMLGAGALLSAGSAELGGSRNAIAEPVSPNAAGETTADPAQAAAAASAPREVDTFEEALDQPRSPLVADPKAVVDTDAEWLRFADFEKECMRGEGFDWRDAAVVGSTNSDRPGAVDWTAGQEPEVVAAINDALFGSTGQSDTYRWDEAGCHGYAVHMTGNDGNH